MRIFVLEDNEERAKWFMDKFQDHPLVLVNHAEPAIAILKVMKFGVLFLDHDLGHKTFVPVTDYNTGSTVVHALSDTMNDATPVVIHSWNIPAAEHMEQVLKDNQHAGQVVRVPFGQFTQNILYNK